MNKAVFLALSVAAVGLVSLCAVRGRSQAAGPVPVAALPERLSQTGWSGPDAVAYAPRYPLWSDGASKRRWIALPPGTRVDTRDASAWQFPIGTRFWKEFSFGARAETRYMERLADGSWRYASYVWDAARGDAFLAPNDGRLGVTEITPGVRHDIPAEGDCRACHEGRRTPVLGYDAVQLGARELDASTPVERAAFGYFYGNCAHCHNSRGPLASLGLELDASGEGAAVRVRASLLNRESAYRPPGEARSLRVKPADAEHSALWFRMQSRFPAAQMPPLGSKLVDMRGVELITTWIRSL